MVKFKDTDVKVQGESKMKTSHTMYSLLLIVATVMMSNLHYKAWDLTANQIGKSKQE